MSPYSWAHGWWGSGSVVAPAKKLEKTTKFDLEISYSEALACGAEPPNWTFWGN